MVIFSILFLLLSNAVTLRRDKSILFSRVAIIVLLYSSLLAITSLYITSLDTGIGLYGGLFHATSTTHIFHIFIFIVSAAILQLTGFYPRRVWVSEYSSLNKLFLYNFLYYRTKIVNKMGEQFKIIEYPLILLFIITGAIFLVSTSDLVSIFLSIELQSYGLYLLSTLYRNSELATTGGLTYFLLGGLSSCFILLGTSLLYANSGTTNLDGIYVITSLSDLSNDSGNDILYWYKSYYINFSLLILSVGFLFKVSAAPFHFWSPDVYDGIPTIVTTYVAIVAKISIFAFLLELIYYTEYNYFDFSWKSIFIYSSLFSLIIGSVLGLTQFRIKRLFAYSTISHVGFILLALAINSTESIQSYIFYILQYSISNLNAFIILVTMGFSFYLYVNKEESKEDLYNIIATEKNNSPIQLISQIKGYFYVNPYLAISLAITLFSFVGIPPIIGFFAKQMILSAALDSGYVFMALVAILTSVIGAAYYLNLIKQIFFYKSDHEINPSINNMDLTAYVSSKHDNVNFSLSGNNIENSNINKIKFTSDNIVISSSFSSVIGILTMLLLLFIYIPGEWFNIVSILTVIIFRA